MERKDIVEQRWRDRRESIFRRKEIGVKIIQRRRVSYGIYHERKTRKNYE